MEVLGIDVGGSGIKGALVDLETGELSSERIRIETPPSFEIDAVADTIAKLIAEFDYRGAVGVGFQFQQFGLQQNGFLKFVKACARLGGNLNVQNVTAHIFNKYLNIYDIEWNSNDSFISSFLFY